MALPPFPERLIPIQNDHDFRTGVCLDGRQVLMGPWYCSVVTFFFDPAGKLLGEQEREGVQRCPLDYERSEPAIREWLAVLGCRTETIRVRPFFVEDRSVGITDGLDLFEDEHGLDAEDVAENAEARQAWIDSGCYVFWWGKDYHMDPNGVVVST